ncbi:MAG: hypothetical protein RLZZ383_1431 [Pseudomonadota bacterium]
MLDPRAARWCLLAVVTLGRGLAWAMPASTLASPGSTPPPKPAPSTPTLTAAEDAWATLLAPRHLATLPCGRIPPASEARVAEADGLLPWVNLRAAACVAASPSTAAADARARWVRDPNLAGLAEVVVDALPRLPASEARALSEALRSGPHAGWATVRLAGRPTSAGTSP